MVSQERLMIWKRFASCLSLLPLALAMDGAAARKGTLVVIGGALKADNMAVYREMVRLAGGAESARVTVIAAASAEPARSGREISDAFAAYGVPASRITLLPLAVLDDPGTADVDESQWKVNGCSEELARQVAASTLVFFCGGDQIRYRRILLNEDGSDTAVLQSVRELFRKGGVVAGTSAGAAVMSEQMIVSGTSLGALSKRGEGQLTMDRGFGLLPGVIVDQHFIKRGRIGRLLAALLDQGVQPGLSWGCGIDEDSAMVVAGDEARIIGRSGLLIIDVAAAVPQGPASARTIRGVRIHYLHHGDSVRLSSRDFKIDPQRKPIVLGEEYNETHPSTGDVFAKDIFFELLTQGLADCRQREVSGLAFDPNTDGAAPGVRLRLFKTHDFRSYLGKADGEYTYSVVHAGLDVTPVRVRIETSR
jgi:cyanophycinase